MARRRDVAQNTCCLKALMESRRLFAKSRKDGIGSLVLLLPFSGKGAKWTDFPYVDPLDNGTVIRSMNDGWVTPGAQNRHYK